MAGEWIDCRLAEACSSIDYGYTAPASDQETGPKFLRITDIVSGHIVWKDVPHVAADDEASAKYKLHDGDIVLARTGASTGASAYVKNPPPAVFASYLVRLQAKPEFDPQFLAYYLKSDQFWTFIRGVLGDKSAQPNASASTMTAAPLRAPRKKDEQRAIAHILGTLDDKIELNRRMSETLEAMARALFKSWFVDFEPVRAKVADLIRECVLEIGDGYRAKNSELGEPGLPFIRAGNLNDGIDTAGAETLRHGSVARAGNKVGRPGDVAFTSKGTIGRFARVTEFTGSFVYSPQVCFWRSLNRERLQPSILYCWMQSDDLKSQIEAVADQTDMAPYVSLRDQREMQVPVFPASQLAIAGRIDALLARQALCVQESKTLAMLRNVLLPKLVSGELQVQDAEKFIEGLSDG